MCYLDYNRNWVDSKLSVKLFSVIELWTFIFVGKFCMPITRSMAFEKKLEEIYDKLRLEIQALREEFQQHKTSIESKLDDHVSQCQANNGKGILQTPGMPHATISMGSSSHVQSRNANLGHHPPRYDNDYVTHPHRDDDITRKVKVDVPEFDGKHNPIVFVDWLDCLEDYFEFYGMTDTHRIRFAKMKLIGSAKKYWQNVTRDIELAREPRITLWEEMKHKLKEKIFTSFPYKANDG